MVSVPGELWGLCGCSLWGILLHCSGTRSVRLIVLASGFDCNWIYTLPAFWDLGRASLPLPPLLVIPRVSRVDLDFVV